MALHGHNPPGLSYSRRKMTALEEKAENPMGPQTQRGQGIGSRGQDMWTLEGKAN